MSEPPFYSNRKSKKIVSGYFRIILKKYVSHDILTVISGFYGDISILFNVYNGNSMRSFIENSQGIFINRDTLYSIDNNNILYKFYEYSGCVFPKYFENKHIILISEGIYSGMEYVQASQKLYHTKWRSNKEIQYKFDHQLKQIKCGDKHSLFLTENGNVYGVGININGQLSDKYIDNGTIQCIIDSNNIQYIDCCGYSSYIITSNHKLKAFGSNRKGQLGINDGLIKESKSIMLASNGYDIIKISCGAKHIGVITMNNELYMYGYNKVYQCGNNKTEECHSGNNVILNNNDIIMSVKCGGYHTILKTDQYKWYSFGDNTHKQLLINNDSYKMDIPTLISNKYLYKITGSNNIIIDILPSFNNTYIIQQKL